MIEYKDIKYIVQLGGNRTGGWRVSYLANDGFHSKLYQCASMGDAIEQFKKDYDANAVPAIDAASIGRVGGSKTSARKLEALKENRAKRSPATMAKLAEKMNSISKEERSERAKKAAAARWNKSK